MSLGRDDLFWHTITEHVGTLKKNVKIKLGLCNAFQRTLYVASKIFVVKQFLNVLINGVKILSPTK